MNFSPDELPGSLTSEKTLSHSNELLTNSSQSSVNERVFQVTDKGVVLPKDPLYDIPSEYTTNPKNLPHSTSYEIGRAHV